VTLIPEEANWESLLKKDKEDPLQEASGFREALQIELKRTKKYQIQLTVT